MEVVKNQERYREVIYSGGALNSATLTINDNEIPISRIKSIKINSPIIDTEKSFFYVGTFTAQKVTIQFKNADSIELNGKVKLTISTMVDGTKTDVNMGEFLIDTTPENYYKSATITCYDKSILFKKNIDISQFFDEEGKITAENLLKALCNHYLGENMLGTYPNVNRNATTALYDNTKSGKYYISDIAEIMGGNAKIGRDGKLYVIPLKQKPIVTINANKGKSWVLNSHYKISRVFYENLTRKYEFGEATDNSLNIRSTNVFVNDNETSGEEIIQNLYNELVGFEMYAIKHENYGDPTLDAWDIIDFQVNGVSYPSYNANTLTYEQNIMSTYETKIPSKQKEETTNVIKNENKQLYDISVTVNQVEGKINQTIQRVDDQEEKITSQEQSLNGLKTSVSTVEKDLATTNSNLEQTNKNVDGLSSKIDGVSADFKDFKDNEYVQSIENLQDQIDGAIQFWNGSAIPTINNYPANGWTTENDRNNHRADIYTVIEDVNGELKQGKSYRFDKVGDTWQWIELTDNELSAVQALAQQALDKSNKNADDIGVLNKKTSELEQTDSEIKASVEELNNRYEQDITTDKKVTGYPIIVEDAGPYNIKELKIYGNSEQDTRSGKNKLDLRNKLIGNFNGLQSTLNEDGSVTTTGKPTANYAGIINGYIINDDLEDSETYTLSQKTANSKLYAQINVKDNDTGTFTYIVLNSNTINQKSFVVDKSKYTYYMNIQTGPMTSWGDEELTITNFYQLEKGSVATDFEKYGAMPSPEFPSEVRNVEPVENLFDYINYLPADSSGLNSVLNEDGSITTIGKPTNNYSNIFPNLISINDILKDKETYTISQKYPSSKLYIQINLYDKITNVYKSSIAINSDTINEKSFVVDKTNYDYKIAIQSTTLSSWGDEELTITNFYQLEKGDKAHEPVPYGHWLKGKITGRNLIDLSNNKNRVINGINYDFNQDGTIHAYGIATDNSALTLIYISTPGTYTLSGCPTGGSSTTYRLFYNSNTVDGNNYKFYVDTGNGVTFNIEEGNYSYSSIAFQVIKGATVDIIIKPQLEEGTEATEYEPYKEKEFLYNMNKYDEEGNIVDYHELSKINEKDDLDFISGVLNKKIGKIVLTGNESILQGTTKDENEYRFSIGVSNLKYGNIQDVKSTHFATVKSDTFDEYGISCATNVSRIFIRDKSFNSISECQQFLKDQYNAGTPVTIYYELETPEQYQLEPINVELFKGYNRITLEDKYGIVEEAEMTYLTDSKLNAQYATRAELKLTADSITSEVNKKVSTDNFNSTISDLDSKITQTAENIRSEVSSTYSTKSETNQAKQDAITSSNTATDNKLKNYTNTTDMNDAIDSAKSDAISSANNNTNEKLKSYSTTTQMQSAIDQKANEITSSVSQTYSTKTEVEEAVSNIEIGGRNLLQYTAFENTKGINIRDSYATISIDNSEKPNTNNKSLKIVATAPASSGNKDIWLKCWSNQIVGENIILSLYIKGSVNCKAFFRLGGSISDKSNANYNYDITTNWAKLNIDLGKITNAGSANSTEIIFGFNSAGTFYINSPKLEYGTKSSDWTPAPEDTDSQIDTAKNDAISSANSSTDNKLKSYSTTTQMNSAIDQKADSITQSVNKQITDINGEITNVKGEVDLKINKDDLFSQFNVNVDQVQINSKNFTLTKEGDITANNANLHNTTASNLTINNGNINLSDEGYIGNVNLNIKSINPVFNQEYNAKISSTSIDLFNSGDRTSSETAEHPNELSIQSSQIIFRSSYYTDSYLIRLGYNSVGNSIEDAHPSLSIKKANNQDGVAIEPNGVIITSEPTDPNHAVRLKDIPKVGTDGYSYDIDGRNLGTITDSGFYYGNNMTGGPYSPFYGFLLVISHASSKYYTTQVLFPQGNVSVVYLRQQNGAGAWSSWYKINAILA